MAGPDDGLTDREADRRRIREAVRLATITVKGGALDGHDVIPAQQLDAILADLAYTPGSAYAVEVSTDNDHPGRVLVYTGCPRCGILQPVTAMVRARLTEDPEAAYIKPVFKVKARDHVCGQQLVPWADIPVPGQLPLDGP